MSTLRLHAPVEWRSHTEGWVLSLFLHGLVAGGAIWLVTDLRLAPQPEPFRWDVSVVATPSPLPAERSAPATPRAGESRQIETRPVTEPLQAVQPVQEVIREDVRDVARIAQTEIATPQIADRTIPPVDVPQEIVPVPPAPVLPTTDMVQPPAINPKPAVEEVERSTASSIPIGQAVARAPASGSSKEDYGWLAQALWSRVEKLKRYPHVARANRWEGRVLLRAVIADDGTLKELRIIESSGRGELDRDALETLERAGPVPLSQPLGRPSVVVQIPISYTLH